ncbi:hypothetical protein MNV49_005162 [Pseudohyphozyma bogoriensis]|nr:hypothetical protein MNV49_005162 [Pseudohyphozyma bogoriensis]
MSSSTLTPTTRIALTTLAVVLSGLAVLRWHARSRHHRGPPFPFRDAPLLPPVKPEVPYKNRIVLIRHAEKPGMGAMGLNEVGKRRAQALRKVYGKGSGFDFGLIFATPHDEKTKERERTFMTVAPLAEDLGLVVDTSYAHKPASFLAVKIEEFVKTSDKDILICWKHRELLPISRALGAAITRHYAFERNDVMWIMQDHEVVEKRSQHCPDLDDERTGVDDVHLALEPL